MLIVVVDDERTFKSDEEIIYLRNSDAAIAWMVKHWLNTYKGGIDQLWLDHDLGGNDTIMPVVDLIERLDYYECGMYIKNIFVHTQNAPAGDAIVRQLKNINYSSVARVPLPELV